METLSSPLAAHSPSANLPEVMASAPSPTLAPSPVVMFEWEVALGREDAPLRWIGDIDGQLGYGPGEFERTFAAWKDALHPEDRPRLMETVERRLRDGEPYSQTCRVRRKDGSYLTWAHSGVVTRDAVGQAVKLTAVHSRIEEAGSREAQTEARLTHEQDRVQQEKARAQSLLRTAAHLNAQLDLQDVCEAICEEAARTIGAPAAVMLFDTQRDAFVPAATINMPRDYDKRYTPTVREIYNRHVAEMGTLFLFTNAQATPDLPNHALYREVNMRTIGIASLIREGEVLGLLKVYSFNEPRAFDENELALLQGLADQAALAIANARTYSESQRRLANLQALRQIDVAILGSSEINVALGVVADQVVSRLGADATSILLLNSRTDTLEYVGGRGFRGSGMSRTSLRLGQGIAGRVALERCHICVPDLTAPLDEAKLDNALRDAPSFLNTATIGLHSEGARSGRSLLSPISDRSGAVGAERFRSYIGVPLVAAGKMQGVLEVWHRSVLSLSDEEAQFLETLAGQCAIAIDNASLFRDLQRSNDELRLAYDSTLEGWSHALDLRDKETEGHSQRVTTESLRLAESMGLSDDELVKLRRGALLHDIGKMGIPDAILLKPGPLTDEEWVIMKKHPAYALELLWPIKYLRPALDIPFCHHEKWDGTGYPRALQGEQIPLGARIFAVIDVWDALCSDRPYRKGWPLDRVLEHIRAASGTHFDPRVVQAFLAMHGAQEGPPHAQEHPS
jgi:HD-GYP domain-containing protein (c-di-GMP phosphodiesterase class II)